MQSSRYHRRTILHLALIILIAAGGCTSGPGRATPTPTPDLQATVDAAILATATAEANEAAHVATAVAATQTATASSDAEATATPGASGPVTPTPEEIPTETYVTMTEEELAALIEDAVNEAFVATESAATVTETATADDTITQEEIDSVEAVIADADEAIALAEELLLVYAGIYGELATETLVLIDDMEALLAATTEMVIVMTDILVEVDTALEQGMEVSDELLADLEAAAIATGTSAISLQQQAAAWPTTVEAELTQRANAALAIQATQIADSRLEAIISAYDYIEITREALSDGRLSQDELNTIAQVGANAIAGIQAKGGAQMQDIPDKLNAITAGVARGQIPQVSGQLQSLEGALPSRPLRP